MAQSKPPALTTIVDAARAKALDLVRMLESIDAQAAEEVPEVEEWKPWYTVVYDGRPLGSEPGEGGES